MKLWRRAALLSLFTSLALLGCGQPPAGDCTVDAECDDDEPCTRDVCDQGICVNNPDDTLIPPQGAPIDCKREICQDGRIVQVPDDTETPNDNVPCTLDACVGGSPVFTPQDNLCSGSPPACRTLVCDPNGLQGAPNADGCSAIPDNTNLPDDGASCTIDSCLNGNPVFTPDHGVCGSDPNQCILAFCDPANQNTNDGTGCRLQDSDGGCDDGLGCTVDSCEVGSGCVNTPNDNLCAPGEICDPLANPNQNPSGCVAADVCPPALPAAPNGTISGDTTGFLDDFAPSCANNGAGHPDLAFALTLTADSDVIIIAESTDGHEISVALVEISGGACGRELLCDATPGLDAEIGVLNLAAGEYAVVVDGNGPGIEEGSFDLTILVENTILAAGDLIINEFHPNPAAVADGDGEFLEIFNATTLAISTAGLTLSENGGTSTVQLTAIGGGQLIIPAGGFAVGVADVDPAQNGGIDADFPLLLSLNNTPNEVFQLAKGALIIDQINTVAGGFPTAGNGASFQLDPELQDADLNDLFDAWCITPNATYGAGDRGTPGAENEPCAAPPPVCGNNVVEAGEECDDGNNQNGDGCDQNCQLEAGPVCGNGTVEAGEQCDDGNNQGGDGCDANCQLEAGGDAILVINEIEYDNIGVDGREFVEIKNIGTGAADLSDFTVIFVDGNNNSQYRRVDLAPGGVLPAGGFAVLGDTEITVPPGVAFIPLPLAANNIQNGDPDGVALFQISTGQLIDALSYEGSITNATTDFGTGFNLVEGTPTSVADNNDFAGTVCRFPDGTDTNNAANDWLFCSTVTPGAPNVP